MISRLQLIGSSTNLCKNFECGLFIAVQEEKLINASTKKVKKLVLWHWKALYDTTINTLQVMLLVFSDEGTTAIKQNNRASLLRKMHNGACISEVIYPGPISKFRITTSNVENFKGFHHCLQSIFHLVPPSLIGPCCQGVELTCRHKIQFMFIKTYFDYSDSIIHCLFVTMMSSESLNSNA